MVIITNPFFLIEKSPCLVLLDFFNLKMIFSEEIRPLTYSTEDLGILSNICSIYGVVDETDITFPFINL